MCERKEKWRVSSVGAADERLAAWVIFHAATIGNTTITAKPNRRLAMKIAGSIRVFAAGAVLAAGVVASYPFTKEVQANEAPPPGAGIEAKCSITDVPRLAPPTGVINLMSVLAHTNGTGAIEATLIRERFAPGAETKWVSANPEWPPDYWSIRPYRCELLALGEMPILNAYFQFKLGATETRTEIGTGVPPVKYPGLLVHSIRTSATFDNIDVSPRPYVFYIFNRTPYLIDIEFPATAMVPGRDKGSPLKVPVKSAPISLQPSTH
jgi:hypothetical protein